jgi:hypothetical protein
MMMHKIDATSYMDIYKIGWLGSRLTVTKMVAGLGFGEEEDERGLELRIREGGLDVPASVSDLSGISFGRRRSRSNTILISSGGRSRCSTKPLHPSSASHQPTTPGQHSS